MREHQARRGCRGQGTLEYTLMIGGVVAAIAVAVVSLLKPAITQTVKDEADSITTASGNLKSGLAP